MTALPHSYQVDDERAALLDMNPAQFTFRPPPLPAELDQFITPDAQLFLIAHAGIAHIDPARWQLVVDGLVEQCLCLNLEQLRAMPCHEVTAVHECYGSPLKPPLDPVMRMGNVVWAGARLADVLAAARIRPEARYVWSEGLDHGQFDRFQVDRYQKDLPRDKALANEVLLAYSMNGEPISRERGGPVRLVVPGFFGTNSTKWLCKLSAQAKRAPGPFTTVLYNGWQDGQPGQEPVWEITPHACMTWPVAGQSVAAGELVIKGWAWSAQPVTAVDVSLDDGRQWLSASLAPRREFEWQAFALNLSLAPGAYPLLCRAHDASGACQPLFQGRNQAHRVMLQVV